MNSHAMSSPNPYVAQIRRKALWRIILLFLHHKNPKETPHKEEGSGLKPPRTISLKTLLTWLITQSWLAPGLFTIRVSR
jgi:hypothetical protein